MSEGTIQRKTDHGFGFIRTKWGNDLFFHMSAVDGTKFELLREGQRVSFTEVKRDHYPRAENVRPL